MQQNFFGLFHYSGKRPVLFKIKNGVRGVSFNVLHHIYAAKEVLEIFKMYMDYFCVCSKIEKETFHLLFYCEHLFVFGQI